MDNIYWDFIFNAEKNGNVFKTYQKRYVQGIKNKVKTIK
jgi:hypothetical protein